MEGTAAAVAASPLATEPEGDVAGIEAGTAESVT
jgi:hypothetical protein